MTRRILYPHPQAHDFLTETAIWHAHKNTTNVFGELLGMLSDYGSGVGLRPADILAERLGASYDALERIGELMGFTEEQMLDWFALAESIPLSAAHAAYILEKLQGRAA